MVKSRSRTSPATASAVTATATATAGILLSGKKNVDLQDIQDLSDQLVAAELQATESAIRIAELERQLASQTQGKRSQSGGDKYDDDESSCSQLELAQAAHRSDLLAIAQERVAMAEEKKKWMKQLSDANETLAMLYEDTRAAK